MAGSGRAQLPEQRQRIDHLINRYLQQLDQADNDDQHIELDSASVKEALKQLQQEKTVLNKIEAQMDERGRNQACMTEPDAIGVLRKYSPNALLRWF